jgi:hypothetical protein
MTIHTVLDENLIMQRDNGTEVFRLPVPVGWLPRIDNPTLFQSPNADAFIGLVPNSQQAIVMEPPMTAAAQLTSIEFDLLSALTLSFNVMPDIPFLQQQTQSRNLSGRRFRVMSGSEGELRTFAAFAHVETIGQSIIFDGFVFLFMNEVGRIAHEAQISNSLDNLIALN